VRLSTPKATQVVEFARVARWFTPHPASPPATVAVCRYPARDRANPSVAALGIRAALAEHRVAFATAAEWVDRLSAAHDAGRL
jgi:hypothetical protein